MSRETHFELFLRKNPKGEWRLAEAVNTREKALERARVLIAPHPKGGVQIKKEERDADGSYRSVVVSSIGHCEEQANRRSKTTQLQNPTPSCVSAADLFTPAARKTYQEVMPQFFEKAKVLPGELVYRPDLLERLEASGVEITQAIQRVSIARAAGGDELHAIARQLHELVSQGIDTVFAQKKNGVFLTCSQGLIPMLDAATQKASPKTGIQSAIVDHLKRATRWDTKLLALLELWEEAEPLEHTLRPLLLETLSEYFSEWIGTPNALAALIGETEFAGEIVDRLIALLESDEKYHDSNDPLKGLTAAVALRDAVHKGVLPSARHTIIGRIFAELSSGKRLYPTCLKTELENIKRFGDRLVHVLGSDRRAEMYEAFCQRSKRLMSNDTVEEFVKPIPVLERPLGLLAFSSNLVGADARNKLAAYVRGTITQTAFETAVFSGGGSPVMTLSTLRATQGAVLESSLPETDRLHTAQDLDGLGVRLLSQSKVFQLMRDRSDRNELAALSILKLASQALPSGQCSVMALEAVGRLFREGPMAEDLKNDTTFKRQVRALTEKVQAQTEVSVG